MSLYLGTTPIAGTLNLEDVVDVFYPVGSVYIGTTATCPLAAVKGTWILVSSGRVLQGADSGHGAGTTIEPGLPNITGDVVFHNGGTNGCISSAIGALSPLSKMNNWALGTGNASNSAYAKFSLDASNSSSVYGNSTTVQPPAYVVNIWERTA